MQLYLKLGICYTCALIKISHIFRTFDFVLSSQLRAFILYVPL